MTETKPMNRIMIYGPKEDSTYVVVQDCRRRGLGDLRAEKRSHMLKHFQARMPYGLVVPDVDAIR